MLSFTVENLELVSYKKTNDKKGKTAVKTTTGKGKYYNIHSLSLTFTKHLIFDRYCFYRRDSPK